MRNIADKLEDDGNASTSENQPALNNLPADGAEWIDFFVREMMVATSVDDARARAARMLEVLEKSISERARAEATDALQKVVYYFKKGTSSQKYNAYVASLLIALLKWLYWVWVVHIFNYFMMQS